MPPETPPDLSGLTKPHRQLVVELGHLRALTGRGLRPFGQRAQMAFTRVRRIESGEVVPSTPEVRAWATAADVTDPATVERLVELAEQAHVYTSHWADHLPDGPGRHLNQIAASWEETSALVWCYQQFIVPGLAQTERYARALVPHLPVDGLDPDAHVAGMTARQDVLHEPGHQFRFLLTRRAWTWNPDPEQPALMDGQRDRLRRVDDFAAAEVRILDDDAPPMGGYSSFTIYDERTGYPSLVVIEIERGSSQLRDPGDVAHYRRRFEQMWAAGRSVSGEEELP